MAYYEDVIFFNDQVKCNLCSNSIEDDDAIIETHVNGNSHKQLEIRRLLVQHSVIVNSTNSFYCRLCNMNMRIYQVKEHLASPDHKEIIERLRQLLKKDGSFLELPENVNDKEVYCVLCDWKLDFNFLLVTDHINSLRHKRARAIAVQPFNGIFSVEGDNGHLWCRFCQRYIDNYVEVILNHIDADDHVTKVAKIINLVKNEHISIEKYLLDPKEDKARCLKCQMDVSCNVMNLESHIKGRVHSK